MTVLIILGVLFLSLIVIVPLIERSKTRFSEEEVSKISRWVLPLMILVLVLQFFMWG